MNLPKFERRPIRLLDPGCVERIAAGEVIERPASAIKELIENSLDAGATRIRVRLKRAGFAEMVVEDDGSGIPVRELPLALERHATSKIAGSGDLGSVLSYGFRGEALASLAAVSRLSLRSRWAEEELGARIDLVGGEVERREPCARLRGTTVEIRDLFFNVPARREFAKSDPSEKRAVTQVLQAAAFAHPEVAFELESDGSKILDLAPARDLETRVHAIFGASVAEHLRRFEGEAQGIRVMGLSSLPTHTRGNRTGQYFFVNRRPVFDKALAHAVGAAYREIIPAGRFAVCLVFLELPPSRIDVNVHPTKAEVRFRDEGTIHTLLRHAIQDSLQLRHEEAETAGGRIRALERGEMGAADNLRSMGNNTLRELMEGRGEGYDRGPRWSRGHAKPTLFDAEALGEEGAAFRPSGAPLDVGAGAQPDGLPLFWQLHNTFILTQIRGALVIIDQHNSHERVLYDQAKRSLAGKTPPTQQLLFPATLELSPDELSVYQVHRGDLERVGFLSEPFGGNTILVRGIPAELRNWNDGSLFRDLLVDLADAGRSGSDPRETILASYACHGAIRAGDHLSLPEMQSLMDRLFATELPYSCPHGRPTLIRLGLPELERRFGRR